MTDVRLLFPADYLSSAWLKGQDVTLTISRVFVDDLKSDRGTERKPVLMFAELEEKRRSKPDVPFKLVLNRTNAKSIAKAIGSHETDDWVGQRVTLYPTTCLAFGETKDCIRVRETAPKPKRRRAAPADAPPDPEPPPDMDEEAAE